VWPVRCADVRLGGLQQQFEQHEVRFIEQHQQQQERQQQQLGHRDQQQFLAIEFIDQQQFNQQQQLTGVQHMEHPPKPVFTIRLQALPGSVPVSARLRMFLKSALRAWGLRALSVTEDKS